MFAHRALRLFLAPAVLGAILLGMGGCSSGPELPKGNTQTLAVGAILPLSGPNALSGKSMRQGMEMATADLNASGGVNGKSLSLGIIDDQSDLTEGAKALQEWRQRNVPLLLIGDSSLIIQHAEEFDDYTQLVAFLTDYVPVPSLTPKNGVRLFLNGDQEGRLIEGYLAAAGVNKVAILYAGNDIGMSNAKYLEFLIHGDYISTYKDGYTPTENNYLPLVKAMSQLNADALVLVGYGPEYPNILTTFGFSGWKGLVFGYLGQGSLNGLGHQTGLAATTLYPVPAFVVDPSATTAGQDFVEEYRTRFGTDPDLFAAYGYDNVRALAAAAAHSASLDPAKIRASFLALKSYTGAVGTYTIKPDGDTEMPLELVDGNGHAAPPPPKPTQAPAMSNVAMPAAGLGKSMTDAYLNSIPANLTVPSTTAPGNTTTPPAKATPPATPPVVFPGTPTTPENSPTDNSAPLRPSYQ